MSMFCRLWTRQPRTEMTFAAQGVSLIDSALAFPGPLIIRVIPGRTVASSEWQSVPVADRPRWLVTPMSAPRLIKTPRQARLIHRLPIVA